MLINKIKRKEIFVKSIRIFHNVFEVRKNSREGIHHPLHPSLFDRHRFSADIAAPNRDIILLSSFFTRGHDHARRDGRYKDVLHTRRRGRSAGGQRPGGGGHARRRVVLRRNVPVGVRPRSASGQRAGRDVLQPVLPVGGRFQPRRGPAPRVQGSRDGRARRPRQAYGRRGRTFTAG